MGKSTYAIVAVCALFALALASTGADAKKKRRTSTLPDTTVTHQASNSCEH